MVQIQCEQDIQVAAFTEFPADRQLQPCQILAFIEAPVFSPYKISTL